MQRLGGLSLLPPLPAPSPHTGERHSVTDTGKDVAPAAAAPVGHDSAEGLILLAAFSTLTCQRNEREKGKKSLIITQAMVQRVQEKTASVLVLIVSLHVNRSRQRNKGGFSDQSPASSSSSARPRLADEVAQ